MGKINILFWRKVTAVIGIFAIINTMLVMPAPAYAAATAIGGAQYQADNGFGNASVRVVFDDVLTTANEIACGGFPATVCFDPADVDLTNGSGTSISETDDASDNAGWDAGIYDEDIIAVMRGDDGDANSVSVVFNATDVIASGENAQTGISVSGFGGMTGTLTTTNLVPEAAEAGNAEYTADLGDGKSRISLFFIGGSIDDVDGTSACASNGSKKCVPNNSVEVPNGTNDDVAGGVSIEEVMIDPDGDNAGEIAIIFDSTNGLTDFSTAEVTYKSGTAGITSDQLFDTIAAAGGGGPAPISAVTLTDDDSSNFGITGNDIQASWTAGSEPSGYSLTKVFVVPEATNLTVSNYATNGCSGGACVDLFFTADFQMTQPIIPEYVDIDSSGDAFVTGSYKACIFIDATVDTMTCSDAATLTSDSIPDTEAPFIEFFPVHTLINDSSSDAIFFAAIEDEQTSASAINDTGDAGTEYFKMKYFESATWNTLDAVQVEGDLFKFTVPQSKLPAVDSSLTYYLLASDSVGNATVLCSSPTAANEAACQSSPFSANTVDDSSVVTITGTVTTTQGTASLEAAKVIVGGLAGTVAAPSTAANGTYTITNVPTGNAYDIAAYKDTYCDTARFEQVLGSGLTGINMDLFSGGCGAGGGERPQVMYSMPGMGMSNVPPEEVIKVFLNQPMDATTITDSDATGASDKIYLTSDDGTTKVAGVVYFCENNESSQSGCSEKLVAGESNAIIFDPSSNLTSGTGYTLIIREFVLSSGGQSINGNRDGGGHELGFTVGGGTFTQQTLTDNYGNGGQYMPPFVMSMAPSPGFAAPTNTKISIQFNDALSRDSVTSSSVYIKDANNSTVTATRSFTSDSSTVIITPTSALSAGEYILTILGSVANSNGVTMRDPNNTAQVAFEQPFTIGELADSTPPTAYTYFSDGSTIQVNDIFDIGFSEALDPTMLTSAFTLKRGNQTVPMTIDYDSVSWDVAIVPSTVLAPNTVYTLSIAATDMAGNAMTASTYSFTTNGADSTSPLLTEVECDDYQCYVEFSESMSHNSQSGSTFTSSVLNHANYNLSIGGGSDIATGSATYTYNAAEHAVSIEGLTITPGASYVMTVTGVKDLSANALTTANSANVFTGSVQDSEDTFGAFGGGMGMFGTGTAGGEFNSGGMIAGVAMDDFFGGGATMAFPFNNMAGQDTNVFQIGFQSSVPLQDGDQVEITFPTGTTFVGDNVTPDTWSPFKDDFNERGAGTVTFDTGYSSDGISVNTATRKVTVQLDVTGNPEANDFYTIDLKGVKNANVPKGPDSGGYTASVRLLRSGTELTNLTTMPWFVMSGGSNTITVKAYASSSSSPDNVSGSLFLFGGGPAGPMDKDLTISAGLVTAADGVVIGGDAGVVYSSLPNGCYFFGTDPSTELSSTSYRGSSFQEPVCVNGGQSVAHNIILTNESSINGATLTVKIDGVSNFGGRDLEIFAGGPGSYTNKVLSNVTTPNAGGYTVKLTDDGVWYVGVGAAMSKGPSSGVVDQLAGMPPPPVELRVSGVDSTPTISAGAFGTPNGVVFDSDTNTVTFTFKSADKTISGTVKDGSGNALSNVMVGAHGGFGMGAYTQTAADGTFTLNVGDYGMYELNAWKDGLPPVFTKLEVRLVGNSDALFRNGKQITGGNPLELSMKKAAYSISGKLLDKDGNAIAYAPMFATNSDGSRFVHGGSDSSGNYTMFVGGGTWTIRAELPPGASNQCGTFSKTVTITNASRSSQNVSSSAATCYTLSGTVTIGGSAAANVPLMVEEWNTGTDQPVFGGVFRPSSTDSSGGYSVEVEGNKTYRVSTWHPDFGEVSGTATVVAADATKNLASGAASIWRVGFTGGEAGMVGFLEVVTGTGAKNFIKLDDLSTEKSVNILADADEYRLHIDGIGDYSGTLTPGGTETIDLSADVTDYLTVSGNIQDEDGDNLVNATVTFKGTGANAGVMRNFSTDSSGNYSGSLKDGDWEVTASLLNYVAPIGASVTLIEDTSAQNIVMEESAYTIEGVIYESDGSTPIEKGKVRAINSASGAVVVADIEAADGSYSIPVADGTWSVEAMGPLHAKTSGSTVTVSGADATGQDVTLASDPTKVIKTASKAVSGSTGGTVDDSANSGIKMTAGSGVLAGSGDVTISTEKSFTAPDTSTFTTLGNTAYEINAEGSQQITELNGYASLEFAYDPSLVQGDEADLKLVFLNDKTGEYEDLGGTVDTVNNTISGLTDHFTTFAVVLSNASVSGGVSGATSSRKVTEAEAIGVEGGDVETEAAEGEAIDGGDVEEEEEEVVEVINETYEEIDVDANTVTYFVPPKGTNEVNVSDISTHWAQNVIKDLASRGIVDTYAVGEDMEFRPDKGMTRAELVKAIVRAKELPIPLSVTAAQLGYYDVQRTSPYAPYIYAAKEAGLVDAGPLFRPKAVVNRAEALKIILIGAVVDLEDYPSGFVIPFADVARGVWFRPHLKYAFHHGIIGGYDVGGKKEFRGGNDVTRAEASKIIAVVFDFDAKDSEIDIAEMVKTSIFGGFWGR